ncbi:MAG: hypothetical protein AAF939_12950 [Planctomycetota bacterium]
MNIRANTHNGFFLKYLLIGIACLAFAAWSLYDGLVKFPGQLPRAAAWEKLQLEVSADQLPDKWQEISAQNGWSNKRPKQEELTEAIQTKIVWQWIFLAIGLVVGLPLILWYLINKNTWVELNDGTITSSSGKQFKPDEVTKFDKKKWEKKGIGVVHYSNAAGKQTFVLDDLKYERVPMDRIVAYLESQIDPSKIVNGLPEKTASSGTETVPEIETATATSEETKFKDSTKS